MCIGILAAGHLRIRMMLEAIQRTGKASGSTQSHEFTQTFDLLVTNPGSTPIDELTVVHPRQLIQTDPHGQPRVDGWDRSGLPLANQMFRVPPERHDDGTTTFWLRGLTDGTPKEPEHSALRVPEVYPVLSPHPVLMRRPALVGWLRDRRGPSLLLARLGSSLAPGQSAMVRLAFQGVVVPPIASQPAEVGPSRQNQMVLETYETWCPEFVWSKLFHLLETHDGLPQDAAIDARRELFDHGLYLPSRTVYCDEHRLAIVTNRNHFVWSTQPSRELIWWQKRGLGHPNEEGVVRSDHWAEIWGAGPNWNPALDPFNVAREIVATFENDAPRNTMKLEAAWAGVRCPTVPVRKLGLLLKALECVGVLTLEDHDKMIGLAGDEGEDLAARVARARKRLDQLSEESARAQFLRWLTHSGGGSLDSLPFWAPPFTLQFTLGRFC